MKKKIWFVKNNNSHYVLRILAASSIRFQPQWSHSSLLKHRNWFLPQWCPLDLATTASIASTQPRPSHPRLVSIFTVSIAQFKLTQIFELLHTALLEVSNSMKCIYRWLFSTRFDSTSCHCFFSHSNEVVNFWKYEKNIKKQHSRICDWMHFLKLKPKMPNFWLKYNSHNFSKVEKTIQFLVRQKQQEFSDFWRKIIFTYYTFTKNIDKKIVNTKHSKQV